MTNIFLEGQLGKLFGREWKLDVSSPGEAMRAINANTKGKLFDYLGSKNKYYKIALQKKKNLIDKNELKNRSGKSNIYIMPTIKGSGSGVGKILAGIALLAIVYFSFGSATAVLPGLLGLSASQTAAIGYGLAGSLILGGITQLLTPVPKFDQGAGTNEDGRQSTLFQGNSNSIVQGGSVGLIYGRALVAPMPISISQTNSDTTTTASTSVGTVEETRLDGGGYEYTPGVSQAY